MTHNTINTDAFDIDPARGLPFCSYQPVLFSEDYAVRYLSDHNLPETGLDERRVTRLATARLEWLLRDARGRLSGQFSSADIVLLMNCFQDTLFFPDQVRSIGSELCDDLGVEVDEWEQSEVAPLLKKLAALSMVERMALADALEQAWHRLKRDQGGHEQVFELLGIELLA
jgi:hypothetical protein